MSKPSGTVIKGVGLYITAGCASDYEDSQKTKKEVK